MAIRVRKDLHLVKSGLSIGVKDVSAAHAASSVAMSSVHTPFIIRHCCSFISESRLRQIDPTYTLSSLPQDSSAEEHHKK